MHISIEIALGHTHTPCSHWISDGATVVWGVLLFVSASKLLRTATGKQTTSLSWARSQVSSYIHWHPYSPCSSMSSPKGDAEQFISPAHPSACMDLQAHNVRDKHVWERIHFVSFSKGARKKKKAKVPYIKSLKTYMLCYSSEHEYYLHMVYYKHLENSVDSK